MRLMDPSEWHPTGQITVWEPTAEMLDTLQSKQNTEQPLSFLQADHVRSVVARRATGAAHQAYTASAMYLPWPVDKARLTGSVNAFLGAHEGLRCSINVDAPTDGPSPNITRTLLSPEEVDLQPQAVDASASDSAEATQDAAEWLSGYFSRTAVSDHMPALAVGLIEDEAAEKAELVLALDHAVGDGLSQVLSVLEIAQRYFEADSPLTTPQHPSFLEYVHNEHAAAAQVTPDSPGTQLWKECIQFVGGMPKLGIDIGVEEGQSQDVKVMESEGPIADPAQVNALRGLAKSRGYSFSTVIYAVLALAHKRMSGSEKYATVTVSSTRGSTYGLSQGWFCNFNPLFFPVEGDTVTEILDAVAHAQRRMKATLNEPVHASLMQLIQEGFIGQEVFQSPQMVTYLDLSWFEEPAGADLRLFGGIAQTKNANFWLARNPEGLIIGSQAPDNPVAGRSVAEYFATAAQIVHETVAEIPA